MFHPDMHKVAGKPAVKKALAEFRRVYSEWLAKGDACGFAAYQTPYHDALKNLNDAVETALHG